VVPNDISDCGWDLSDGEDAELLVYLVNEEMDIYIGIRRCLPPWFCRADLPPWFCRRGL
jgi:hypothetical protein